MRFFAVALLCCGAASYAQTPQVPQKMGFAGMTLAVRDDARLDIQKDVDGLMAHSRYYNMKVERARTYFPIIEKIFAEEGIPDDFKYLVLQESALVSDAVSVSNAVGYWQFKDFTALEMGMRVDKEVDERMNLVSSTRAAARYLKKSNVTFDNWLLTLQSYQMGAGGARRAMGDSWKGARTMEVTPETYWYVRKFLAHKVAFEGSVAGEGQIRVIVFEPNSPKTLKDIANEVSAQESDLVDYNKWLKGTTIPADKTYAVLIPVGKLDGDFDKLVLASAKASKANPLPAKETGTTLKSVNSIPVVVALPNESVVALSARGGIGLSSFLKYNDIPIDHQPEPGAAYLLSKKKSRGDHETYKVKPGDDLWTVSQRVGVKMKNLKKYNRLTDTDQLAAGSLLWLTSTKPEMEVVPVGEEAVLAEEEFDWDLKMPAEKTLIVDPQPIENPTPATTEKKYPDSVVVSQIVVLPVQATTHLVKAGDTFYSISKLYSIEITDLLTWNNLTIQSGLKPGQVLKLVEIEPIKENVNSSQPASVVTHEVKPSDTLYSIARQYGVTIKEIMDWNNKKDFSLTRGEKLEIRQERR